MNPTYSGQIDLNLEIADASFLGSPISFTSKVEILDDSGNILNTHIDILESIINCAYDPNDKLVHPDRDDHFALIENSIQYTIRFQNTGNDFARNVSILDTLDGSLDMRTFRLINSSHSEVLSVLLDDNIINFYFENILLPDSTSNLDASNGFVQFTIQPFSDVLENTEVNNTAHIIFDFNPFL